MTRRRCLWLGLPLLLVAVLMECFLHQPAKDDSFIRHVFGRHSGASLRDRGEPTATTLASAVEMHGLRVTVKQLYRVQSQLKLTFTHQWVPKNDHETQFLFMRSWSVIDVYFWDRADKVSPMPVSVRYVMPEDFVIGSANFYETTITVSIPDGAEKLCIGLGRSGILTRWLVIPADKTEATAKAEVK